MAFGSTVYNMAYLTYIQHSYLFSYGLFQECTTFPSICSLKALEQFSSAAKHWEKEKPLSFLPDEENFPARCAIEASSSYCEGWCMVKTVMKG